MALLDEALKEKQLDVRMVQRALGKGLLGVDEIEKQAKKLVDDSANSEYTSLETLAEGLGGKSGLRD